MVAGERRGLLVLAVGAIGLCVAGGMGPAAVPDRTVDRPEERRPLIDRPVRSCARECRANRCVSACDAAVGRKECGRGRIPASRQLSTALLGVMVPLVILALLVGRSLGTPRPPKVQEKDSTKLEALRTGLWERVKTYDPVQHTRHTIIVALHGLLVSGGVHLLANDAHPWLIISISWIGSVLLGMGFVVVANLHVRIAAANKLLGEGGSIESEAHSLWLRCGYGDKLTSGTLMMWGVPGVFFLAYMGLIVMGVYGPPC